MLIVNVEVEQHLAEPYSNIKVLVRLMMIFGVEVILIVNYM